MHYTVHPPPSHEAERDDTGIIRYSRVAFAMKAAYRHLPLDVGSYVGPIRPGAYVAVQEWDADYEPHRQWLISGRS